jgi:hypothetical protein
MIITASRSVSKKSGAVHHKATPLTEFLTSAVGMKWYRAQTRIFSKNLRVRSCRGRPNTSSGVPTSTIFP